MYRRQSHVGDNDSIESTGGVLERLVLVAVRVILVFEHLSVILAFPGHGGFSNTNVALGGH